ncbi:cation:proton antiporter [Pedobacter sp.]|uniref:cation:proton antiporter n=1 Tax=Pedobacter sp. TaxID=1411316 RepID=UPI003D7F91EC
MDNYILLLTLFGLAAFAMTWMPVFTKKTGISYSVIYVLAGVLIYLFFPKVLPAPDPSSDQELILRITEVVVIISLMGTGLKIDRSFSLKNWASPLKLIIIAMVGSIAGAAFLGYTLFNFDLASAMLLGAVLAPTDPVLASDVQVEPPNTGIKSEARFSLTAEAGLNDGMAFPFTWLAITLALMAGNQANEASLAQWFAFDVLYKITAGLVLGFATGRLVGFVLFRLTKKYTFLETTDGFLAISLTLLVYGLTELIQGYGFIAVFICAISLRHFEKKAQFHNYLHSFTDQIERLLIAVVLILFGAALTSGILSGLTWKMVLFTLLFLLIVRPLTAYISLYKANIHIKEKLAISFFGIRGLGSIFYLTFAFKEANFFHEKELWTMVTFTILISLVMHGFTATTVMKHLKKTIPEEQVPE